MQLPLLAAAPALPRQLPVTWEPQGGAGSHQGSSGVPGRWNRVTPHPQHHCPLWGSQSGDTVTPHPRMPLSTVGVMGGKRVTLHQLTPVSTVGATGWTWSHHTPNATVGVPGWDMVTPHFNPTAHHGGPRGSHSHTAPPNPTVHHGHTTPHLLWGSQGDTVTPHSPVPPWWSQGAHGDIIPPQRRHVPHSLRTSASPPWRPCPTGTKSTWRRSASLQKSSPRPSPAWSTLPKNCPCFQR